MDRKDFIKKCSYTCLGASSMGVLLQSCVSTKMITSEIIGENIIVPFSEFNKENKNLKYIIIQNPNLKFPIYVFRFSERKFSALYLRCTHQGNELNAYGEKLVCSAHGSEFDTEGNVTNGPANMPLKSFPIKITNQEILISLKKA